MASVGYTYTADTGSNDDSIAIYSWAALTTTNTDGSPISIVPFADRCVQVTGTFGAGGSISVQGSNDGTNYAILKNAQGTAATFTAAGIQQIVELPRYMRPLVTAGDGTTSLTATLVARRANPLRT